MESPHFLSQRLSHPLATEMLKKMEKKNHRIFTQCGCQLSQKDLDIASSHEKGNTENRRQIKLEYFEDSVTHKKSFL